MALPVPAHVHVHSIRLESGDEALAARVLMEDGTEGFGFSLRMDATAARHMAMWDAVARRRAAALREVLEKEGLLEAVERDHGKDWEKVRRGLEPRLRELPWLP